MPQTDRPLTQTNIVAGHERELRRQRLPVTVNSQYDVNPFGLTGGDILIWDAIAEKWKPSRSGLPTAWVTLVDWDATGWKYLETTLTDATDYSAESYADGSWSVGAAAFGSGTGPTPRTTNWPLDSRIWLRRLIADAVSDMRVTVRIDNYATVWVNGTQILDPTQLTGSDLPGQLEYGPFTVSSGLLHTAGNNEIAIRADDDAASTPGDVCFIDMKVEAQSVGLAGDVAWTNGTLVNSWTNVGSGYAPAGYRKDGSGYVHLRGLIASGATNTTAFTLPAGYRPAFKYPTIAGGGSAPNFIEVQSTGGVVVAVKATTNVSLEGIVFLAEL